MLMGEFNCIIDIKGRLNFPAKLRDDLGGVFVLCKGTDQECLFAYSAEAWKGIEAQIDELDPEDAIEYRRFLSPSAGDVEPDKQGRIVIPAPLRSYAKLEKDVVVVGVSNHCEVWSKENWDRYNQRFDPERIRKISKKVRM